MNRTPRLLVSLVVIVAGIALAAPLAVAGAGLSNREAAHHAAKAASRYTARHFGIHGSASAWSARCRTVRRDAHNFATFSCRVRFNGGQCAGRLRFSERRLRAYAIRIGCGE